MESKYTDTETLIQDINKLKNYQGFVQFSDRRIEDVFEKFSDIKVEAKKGFVYEAHFYNGKDSITIKQINHYWLVDEIKNISLDDTQIYIGINNLKVKMAQIWEAQSDELCVGMEVMKLKKVVFVGFTS